MKKHRRPLIALLVLTAACVLYLAKQAFTPRYQDKTVAEWFVDLYQEPNSSAPKAAFQALGKRAVPYCLAELKRQPSILDKWLASAADRLPWAAAYIPISRPVVRPPAAQALEQIAPPAVPALAKALQHPHSQVRFFACLALGRIQPATAEAEAALARALGDPAVEVRLNAV